jgi:hypothetical protein
VEECVSERSKLTQAPPHDATAALEQARKARRHLAATRATLEAALKAAESRADTAEAQLEALLGVAQADPKPIRALKAAGKAKPEAAYVMMASDWHVGERVRPQMVGGLNEYTPEIAQERAEQYFRSNLKMLNAARSAWDVRQLVFWWGGDFMTGYIHEEYQAENYLSPTEEMFLAYEVLLRGVRFILAEYDVERVVIPTSSGNHGRGTKKKQTSDFRTSYEFLMYRMLQKALADEPRVEVKLGTGYENHLDIYGFRVAFHHGDEVQYNGGVGGIYPALFRRIHRVGAGGFARELDVFGHHHTLGFAPAAFGNGSLIGYSAFAAAKGFRPEPPQQGSFVIDAKHRVPSAMNPIFVTR